MSYNWTPASTPQGRERLKELCETEIVYRSSAYGISVVYIDTANLVLKDIKSGITNITEFLDPSPQPQQPDENGLLQTILNLPDDTSAAYIKDMIHDQLKRA